MPPNVGKTFGGIFLYIGWIECCNNERVKKIKSPVQYRTLYQNIA